MEVADVQIQRVLALPARRNRIAQKQVLFAYVGPDPGANIRGRTCSRVGGQEVLRFYQVLDGLAALDAQRLLARVVDQALAEGRKEGRVLADQPLLDLVESVQVGEERPDERLEPRRLVDHPDHAPQPCIELAALVLGQQRTDFVGTPLRLDYQTARLPAGSGC